MVRYGIVGCGMMGEEHIRFISLLDHAVVTAVADPLPENRVRAAALAGGDVLQAACHRDLLAADVVDALVIASPNHTHAEVLGEVMASELPVLVEKPLATSDEGCEALLALGAARTAPVWVAMEYRYMPPVARLVEEVAGGTAGRLRMLTIREHRYPFLDKFDNWNRFARFSGGTLVEKCCHFFDLMRLITGSEATRVYASGAQDVNHLDERYDGETPDILDNALVVVDFASGVRACLDLCMFADGSYFQEHVTAVGERAKVEALVPGPARFWGDGTERDAEVIVSPRATQSPERHVVKVDEELLAAGDHHGSTYYQHVHFNRLVREGGEPAVTLADGAAAVRIGLAAERSARSGEAVTLDPPA